MSTNPFEERRSTTASAPPNATARGASRSRRRNEGEPPIWAARNVEWPIPASLSLSNYQKLLRASKQAGNQLGIVSSALDAAMDHKDGDGGESGGAAADSQNYYGLSGFMSRVLNTSGAASLEKPDDDLIDQDVVVDSKRGSKPLRPPRNGCVATANGWIVAALECPAPTASGASPLRLVSRWNVRRGSSADQWTALPPPVGGDGRIMHVFVDPTGCHTLLSARNGEAYYLHSSSRVTQKLLGFGKNPDGSLPKDLTGVAATSVVRSSNDSAHVASIIQEGFTAGSYVTAVAWDRERGTEGSTKRIILGTSIGELYEYSLVSPNSEGTDDSVPFPILLHKLHLNEVDPSEMAAAVTGVFFERWRVGMLILVATSGRHKRTRFHTFYSPSDTAFRLVLANQQNSTLVELPGSVDFADLRLCNDNFALRTATGVYYGTFDRSQTGAALLTAGSGVVAESGILPYETGKQPSSSSSIPVSVALTPHHLITLYESNEVRFINRVAHKVVQKEKVDWVGATPGASLDESAMGLGELLTDIRRPEQVWLRKSRSLIHISSSQEDRDVWKYTLEKCLAAPSKPFSTASSQLSSNLVSSLSGPGPVLSDEEKAQESLFEHAKSLCTNSIQKSVVTAVRAEYHLSQGRAELAAKYLAQCPPVLEAFADTSIRLALPMLGIDDPTSYGGSTKAKRSLASSNLPLITYLSDKMRVARMNDDNVTCTMIGAWLTELHLHERERTAMAGRGAKTLERSQQALLAQLLANHVSNMDSKTIMRILSSHDVSAYECASYASASGDIATAVNAALSLGSANTSGALEALRILNSSAFEIAEPLYYKHAPTFLERAPTAAAQSFLSKFGQGLSPTKLLPSFMHYEQLRTEKARAKDAALAEQSLNSGGVEESKVTNGLDDIKIVGSKSSADEVEMHLRPGSSQSGFIDDPAASTSYFEGVVKMGCRSSAIFSYLISLYVKMVDEEPLFRFLTTHVPAAASVEESVRKALLSGDRSRAKGEDLSFPLGLSYALRSVLNSGRHYRSAVKLYTALGMLQQAVELALKVDPSLARELAQESVDVDERRRLWLMIARNAATASTRGGSDVVSKVVSVLKDCGPDVLSIEDVLPFLPDFTQIDQIKDEICSALMSYASKIEGYLKEMNECDQTCDALREEIMRLSTHRMEMKTDSRCAFTKKLVLSAKEPFYVFPSGYVILESALKKEVLPHLNAKQRARVKEIELLLQQQKDAESRELLQGELDGLIAAECPLTGLVAVESVDRGFEGTEFDDALLDRRDIMNGASKSDKVNLKANV